MGSTTPHAPADYDAVLKASAAARHIDHGLAGDIPLDEALTNAELLIAAARSHIEGEACTG